MKAIAAFLAGLTLGYLLRRNTPAVLSPAPFPGWPVAGTVEYEAGDAWPAGVTWSYAPPNPGSWN